MKETQESRDLPVTSRNQFRTPRRPSPRGSATALKNTAKQNQSPESSTSASTRKRASLPQIQSTLTQIDFVTQPQVSDDDELEYIDGHQRREKNDGTTEQPRIDDGPDKYSDYLPAPPVRSVRMSNSHPNGQVHDSNERPQKRRSSGMANRDADRGHGLRKSETPRPSARPKGGRKSLEKSTGKRDKTLTQMDFVRRYITIDDDDDVNMNYIQPTPRVKSIKNEPEHTPKPNRSQATEHPISDKRKRRRWEDELDLSTGEPISQSTEAPESNPGNGEEQTSFLPITPQKSRMREIPSSQTPESPGLAIITSSQFHSATRSPSKQQPLNLKMNPMHPIKQESPGLRRVVDDSQDFESESFLQPTKSEFPSAHYQSNQDVQSTKHEEIPLSVPPAESGSLEISTAARNISGHGRSKREKTVIYETDAESEYGDFDDSLDKNPPTPSPKKISRVTCLEASTQRGQNSQQSAKDDSEELPLPGGQSSLGLDDAPPSEGPMSDASICYQRMQTATQFPHEPIPMLNTQKMSELFPNEDSTQYPKAGSSKFVLRNQTPGHSSQIQTQSQGGDKEPTELIPESSPIRDRENENESGEASFQRPCAPGSVVQVESSQAVDRDPHWPGPMISRSQLLTSSVMESIPLPNFWMGSQDSVGEPYSLPEG